MEYRVETNESLEALIFQPLELIAFEGVIAV
jgi:hypothetical protein